ncbi:hypothetical protein ElyMa_002099300 [Elysia marginata]|uniref:VWFD domain-containing protein n=1 Tax=Elysia marginata TaxID=1093978 RepID=A0AAV4FFJ2_9GAST|nr:hypothetical protein ElyMa_002099300 [Elysia marginata]
MVYTLRGCGFNGFQQISGFHKCFLEGFTARSDRDRDNIGQPQVPSAVLTPLPVLELCDNVQVKGIVFTWARIAAALTKDGATRTLFSGAPVQVPYKSCDQVDGEVICATEKQFLLRLNGQTNLQLKSLADGDLCPQPCLITESKDDQQQYDVNLYASHSDVYYIRGKQHIARDIY